MATCVVCGGRGWFTIPLYPSARSARGRYDCTTCRSTGKVSMRARKVRETVTPNGPREYRVKFTDGDEAEYTDSTIGLEAAQAMLGKRQGVIEYNDHAGWFELDGAASQAANASTPAADATPAAPVAPTEG